MTLKEYQDRAQKQLRLHADQLDEDLDKTTDLMIAYSGQHSIERSKLKELQREYKIKAFERSEFYLGTASPEKYREEPLDRKILKTDVKTWVDTDDEIMEIQKRIDEQEEIVSFLGDLVDLIRFRNNSIKTRLDIMKWYKGQDL